MKKTTVLSFFLTGVVISSCRKNYTCDCTVTRQHASPGSTLNVVVKNESTAYGSNTGSFKMTEKQAESACKAEAAGLEATYESIAANSGTPPDPNDHFTYSCVLK